MFFINLFAFVCIWLSSSDSISVEKPPVVDPVTGKQNVITISKWTTFYTEPLTPDGFPDFLEALNQSRGQIRAEDNAAIDLAKIFGFGDLSNEDQNRYAQRVAERLGLKAEIEPVFKEDFPEYYERKTATPEVLVGPHQKEKVNVTEEYAPKVPWTKDDHPDLYEWLQLEQTRQAVQLIEAMVTKPEFFWPYAYENDKPESYTTWRHTRGDSPIATPEIHCGKVLMLQSSLAMLELGEGRVESASRRLLQAHALACLIAKQPIESAYSLGIHELLLAYDQVFANHPAVSLELLNTHHAELRRIRQTDHGFAMAIHMMRIHELNYFCHVAGELTRGRDEGIRRDVSPFLGEEGEREDAVLPSVSLDACMWTLNLWYQWLEVPPEMTESQLIAHYSKLENGLEQHLKLTAIIRVFLNKHFKQVGPWLRGFTIEPMVTIWYLQVLFRLVEAEKGYLTTFELTETVFAIERHQREHGAYPENLSVLVGNSLVEMPKDRFDGKELTYRLVDGEYEISSEGRAPFPIFSPAIRFQSRGWKPEKVEHGL